MPMRSTKKNRSGANGRTPSDGRGSSIQRKIMGFLAAYSAVLIASVLGFTVVHGFNVLRMRAQDRLDDKADLLGHGLDDGVGDTVADIEGLAARLERGLREGAMVWRGEAKDIVLEFLAVDPFAYGEISIANSQTREVIIVRPVLELGEIQPWVQHARGPQAIAEVLAQIDQAPEANDRGVTVSTQPDRDVISVMVPIPLRDEMFLVAQAHLSHLISKAMNRLGEEPSMDVLVTNQRGIVLAGRDVTRLRKHIGRNDPFLMDAWHASAQDEVHASSLNALALIRPVPEMPLTMVLIKNLSREHAAFGRQILVVLLFCAVLAGAAYAFARYVANRLSASVRHMTQVARKVAQGDFNARIALRRNDEIGVLIDTFNHMVEELRSSYDALHAVNRELAQKLEELKRTRQELSSKQRLALLGEAISKISHEIQNKIGSVSIWAQNLERLAPEDADVRLCVSEIKASIAEFTHMLSDFKRFYREPRLEVAAFTLGELGDKVRVQVATELRPKRLTLRWDLHDEHATVLGDQRQLLDVLVNLLMNAMYYSDEDGEIQVRSECCDGQLVISVCDRGPGVSADELSHLVQPFTSTKPTGSGLGLAIAHNVVTAHGGRLTCARRKSGGARFSIWLPLEGAAPPSEERDEYPSG